MYNILWNVGLSNAFTACHSDAHLQARCTVPALPSQGCWLSNACKQL